jgi:hypothetical protein
LVLWFFEPRALVSGKARGDAGLRKTRWMWANLRDAASSRAQLSVRLARAHPRHRAADFVGVARRVAGRGRNEARRGERSRVPSDQATSAVPLRSSALPLLLPHALGARSKSTTEAGRSRAGGLARSAPDDDRVTTRSSCRCWSKKAPRASWVLQTRQESRRQQAQPSARRPTEAHGAPREPPRPPRDPASTLST